MLALKNAEMAGIAVPFSVWRKAGDFVDSVTSRDGWRCGYMSREPRDSLIPQSLLLLAMSHKMPGRQALDSALDELFLIKPGTSPVDLYRWFFSSRAMTECNGSRRLAWMLHTEAWLASAQDNGLIKGLEHQKGSWFLTDDTFATLGGRLFCTSLAILILADCCNARLPGHAVARNLTSVERSFFWQDLASEDFAVARRAMLRLRANRVALDRVVRENLLLPGRIDEGDVKTQIAMLESDKFSERAQSAEKLTKNGRRAAPVIRQALTRELSLESRRRLTEILAIISPPESSAAGLRLKRVLWIVASLRQSESSALLRELSSIDSDDWFSKRCDTVLTQTRP
jgi:hypothetical protein